MNATESWSTITSRAGRRRPITFECRCFIEPLENDAFMLVYSAVLQHCAHYRLQQLGPLLQRLIIRVPFVCNNKMTQQRRCWFHLRHLNGAEASGERVCTEEPPVNRKPQAAYAAHLADCTLHSRSRSGIRASYLLDELCGSYSAEGSLTTQPGVWPTSKAEKDSFVNLSVLGGSTNWTYTML